MHPRCAAAGWREQADVGLCMLHVGWLRTLIMTSEPTLMSKYASASARSTMHTSVTRPSCLPVSGVRNPESMMCSRHTGSCPPSAWQRLRDLRHSPCQGPECPAAWPVQLATHCLPNCPIAKAVGGGAGGHKADKVTRHNGGAGAGQSGNRAPGPRRLHVLSPTCAVQCAAR